VLRPCDVCQDTASAPVTTPCTAHRAPLCHLSQCLVGAIVPPITVSGAHAPTHAVCTPSQLRRCTCCTRMQYARVHTRGRQRANPIFCSHLCNSWCACTAHAVCMRSHQGATGHMCVCPSFRVRSVLHVPAPPGQPPSSSLSAGTRTSKARRQNAVAGGLGSAGP
jgi:hypothetical protein